jgi:hypothetical protein
MNLVVVGIQQLESRLGRASSAKIPFPTKPGNQ